MDLYKRFVQHVEQFGFFQKTQKQLVAVSGGVDSVVLCNLLFKAGYDFSIAHCNFKLRGAESDRDENFVRSLEQQYGKEVLIKQFETESYVDAEKLSIQVAARQLRYNWFHELLEKRTFAYLLTAHHADDNIETLLINFFKGTGIRGLHGILPFQQKIFRPLLFAKKEELLLYAKENKLAFVEDSSNASDKYTRNYFRHQLLPLLKSIYPNVEDNLLKSIHRFREVEILYNQALDLHKKKLVEAKGTEVHIPVLKLQKAIPRLTILYEILKDFGFTPNQTKEVEELLDSESGRYIASSSHRIIKNRKWLIVSPVSTVDAANILIEKSTCEVEFAKGILHLKVIENNRSFQIPSAANIAALNAREVTFPLLLRKWKQGDYFYPLGMRKKKKLSRFLIDIKLSKPEKENIWVIESNKKIIWIVGYRIDDRFKIETTTKEVLQISLNTKN